MTGQPRSSRCLLGCPCLAAGLHSADRSASTPLLILVEGWWSGHSPAPVTRKQEYMIHVYVQELTGHYSSNTCHVQCM